MRTSELIILAYLAYLAVLAWIQPLPSARRRVVTIVALLDIGFVWWLSSARSPFASILRDWLPALQILIGYWLSGAFFLRPMPRIEAWLAHWDRRLFEELGAGHVAARGPRWLLEYFELAYLTVYLLVPLGFGVAYWFAADLDVDRYWTIVVGAELVCYAMLPWIQTRPPRALRLHAAIEDRRVAIHRLNGLVLSLGSIQVNTFPSGHAAGAFATAFAVATFVPSAFVPFLVLAASITIGSVIGRYHYAADSVAGAVVAVLVWVWAN
ncbi:MAG TPA: phosphatase PAP2 family protein [Vicinamibacterales bacterium]|nr:phosphatase PAP2 family protein [Vicinamibacterales bacterium]